MNLEKLTTNCLCTSVFLFLFVFLLFKKTREGQDVGSDEVKIGKNWKLKPVLPNDEQMKKLQAKGGEKKMKPEDLPKNLAFMFSPKKGEEWKEVYRMYPSGIMEGKEFKKMKAGG